MKNRTRTHPLYPALLVGIILALLGVTGAIADSSIDSTDKHAWGITTPSSNIDANARWAWGTDVGWINFNPTHGDVTVYADHLEGHAWGENVGWIRLGTHTGGGAHTYTNDAAGTYGVNNDGSGSLSGYAWGTNVGWINFSPTYGGVTIDPQTGAFDGYAWGENVGWISFKGTGYGVVTSFRNYKTHLPLVVRQ
jgi:hypothetical protein